MKRPYRLSGFPLAPESVQHRFNPDWQAEYADQWHGVHVLPNGAYVRWDEDAGNADNPIGSAYAVFLHGDWALRNARWVKDRIGWFLRVNRAAAELMAST